MSTLKQVMVIDDNETDRYIAKRNITKLSFAEEVIEMDSAKKALEYLSSLKGKPELLPDFIFLDINARSDQKFTCRFFLNETAYCKFFGLFFLCKTMQMKKQKK